MIGVALLHILRPELVLEALRPEIVLHQIGDVGREKGVQIALRRAAFDLAHGAIERWMHGLQFGECFVDGEIDSLAQRGSELGKKRLCPADCGGIERAVEAFQDAVIERSLLPVIDLQLTLGIVDIADAEEMLEEKLLGALAEVFELRRRDGLQCVGDEGLDLLIAAIDEQIAVENRSRPTARDQLELAGKVCGDT